MRRSLLFIFPILLIVGAVLTVFGILQVSFEKDKLTDDLKRRSMHVADGMELSVKNIIESRDTQSAEYLVQKFEKRERVQGCAIYDKEGNIIAITVRFHGWINPHAAGLLKFDTATYEETGDFRGSTFKGNWPE